MSDKNTAQPQKIMFVVFFRLIKSGLGFIFFYIAVLFYVPHIIGTVQFCIAFVAIFSFIFNLRFSIAHLKIYPEEENKAACVGTLLFYKFVFIIIAFIFYFSLLIIIGFETILTILIIIFLFEQVIQGLDNAFINVLVADGQMIKAQFPWVINSITRVLFLIIGILFYELNEITLASAYILSTLIHFVFLFIYFIPYKVAKPNKYLLKKYFKFTYPLTFLTVVTLISTNIGIILIDFWISTEAVAFYYAADHLSVFRTIIPSIISLVMVPIFSKNIKQNHPERNKRIIKMISRYSCLIFGMIIMLAFLYSDEIIITFIGETYYQSILIFNIIVLAQIIYINDIGVYADLNARGLTKLYSTLSIIGEIFQIFLIIFFIAPNGLNLGIQGVAFAMLFRHAIYSPILRFYLWKKYNYSYNFEIFIYLISAFLIYGVNYLFLADLNLFTYFYLIPILAIINIILYFGVLYILRGVKKEDLRYLKLMFNLKSLINTLYTDLSLKKGKNNS